MSVGTLDQTSIVLLGVRVSKKDMEYCKILFVMSSSNSIFKTMTTKKPLSGKIKQIVRGKYM